MQESITLIGPSGSSAKLLSPTPSGLLKHSPVCPSREWQRDKGDTGLPLSAKPSPGLTALLLSPILLNPPRTQRAAKLSPPSTPLNVAPLSESRARPKAPARVSWDTQMPLGSCGSAGQVAGTPLQARLAPLPWPARGQLPYGHPQASRLPPPPKRRHRPGRVLTCPARGAMPLAVRVSLSTHPTPPRRRLDHRLHLAS